LGFQVFPLCPAPSIEVPNGRGSRTV
jgi:hypothetical protein